MKVQYLLKANVADKKLEVSLLYKCTKIRVIARLSDETFQKRKPGNPHSVTFKPGTNPYVCQESNGGLQNTPYLYYHFEY